MREIIVTPEALSEDYLPPHLFGREREMKELAFAIEPATKGRSPLNCLVSGAPGMGKTVVAKHLLKKLNEETSIRSEYLNCWSKGTLYAILCHLTEKWRLLGCELQSTKVKLEKVESCLQSKPFVLVLDEIDLLHQRERNAILRAFLDIENLGLVCICNSAEQVLLTLDDRVRSRFMASKIYFKPYSYETLVEILTQRAEHALYKDSWSMDVLKLIARLSRGDARIAIQTLRLAGEIAETQNNSIQLKHIQSAYKRTRTLKKTYLLKRLSEHHLLIYQILLKHPGILSGELWDNYLEGCKRNRQQPVAPRTFRDYLEKLSTLKLIRSQRASVRGRVRSFWAVKDG
ncbi:MAG: Cdc6/Cdc18 family protein [bacterium]